MLKIIATYHIAFGILAIFTTIFPQIIGYFRGNDLINYLFGGLLILFGILIFRKNRFGILGLLIINFLQVFGFQTDSIAYRFTFGVNILFDFRNLDFAFFLSEKFIEFPIPIFGFFNCFGDGSYFSINLFAVSMIYFLLKDYQKFKMEKIEPWELGFQK